MASSEACSANPDFHTVIAKIGEGGFGDVYTVRDKFGNVYALKKINISKVARGEDSATKRALRKMALKEVKTMKSLADNKNIVRILDYFNEKRVIYIAMELCSEGSLKDALTQKQKRGQWFGEGLLVNWLVQLVSALKYCHNKQILHRDIKPQNILLASGGRTVKLGDFGIAKALNTSTSLTTTFVGTVPYLPPESFNEGSYTYASEVWALGCVMYELMAQKQPFMAQFPGAIIAAIVNPNPVEPLPPTKYSGDLREFVVSKMLRKDPNERPSMVGILSESFVLEGIANLANPTAKPSEAPAASHVADSTHPIETKDIDVGAILQASETGDLATVRKVLDTAPRAKLLDSSTWQKSTVNGDGETPLHRAAWKNQLSVMELLWPIMGEKLGLVEDAYHVTPIGRAAASNAIHVVEFILRNDISYLEVKMGRLGRTLLHIAAGRGRTDLCVKLVNQYGANLFAKSSTEDDEELAIHLAASAGHVQLVKFFVAKKPGIELEKNGDGDLAIHKAAAGGHFDLVEYFLKGRSQLVHARGYRGLAVLHLAAIKDNAAFCAKLVKQYGADVLAKTNADVNEEMPIHFAASIGHLAVVKCFTTAKPGIELLRNGEGDMAINKAALGGRIEVVDFFLREKRQLVNATRGYKGRTILHQAAGKGHVELCGKLVGQYGADLFAQSDADDDEEMPIHLAAFCGQLAVVKYFVAVKPSMELEKNGDGDLAIHKATHGGHTEVIEYFLKERRQSVDVRGYKGLTILHFAALKGNLELCIKLVNQYGADVLAKSNATDDEERPIHLCVLTGQLAVVKFFVTVKPGIELERNGEGNLPINKAALAGQTQVVEYFLNERGQSVNTRGSKGRTILHQAAGKGHLELCQKLVSQYGADLLAMSHAEDESEMPIHYAALCGKLPVVKYFVATKPGIELQTNGEDDLAIHKAALGGQTEMVEYFLKERRQSVQVRGYKGRTILHQAAANGNVELCVKLVSQYGADVCAASRFDDDEDTPLHFAALCGHQLVVKYFVAVKPGIERRQNGRGSLAVHKAALRGQTQIVEYFLNEMRLSVEVRGFLGRTLLHQAAGRGYASLCETLVKKFRADVFAKSNADDDEDMPIHLAAWAGELAVVDFFVKTNRKLVNARNGNGETPRMRAMAGVSSGNDGAEDVVAYLTK